MICCLSAIQLPSTCLIKVYVPVHDGAEIRSCCGLEGKGSSRLLGHGGSQTHGRLAFWRGPLKHCAVTGGCCVCGMAVETTVGLKKSHQPPCKHAMQGSSACSEPADSVQAVSSSSLLTHTQLLPQPPVPPSRVCLPSLSQTAHTRLLLHPDTNHLPQRQQHPIGPAPAVTSHAAVQLSAACDASGSRQDPSASG